MVNAESDFNVPDFTINYQTAFIPSNKKSRALYAVSFHQNCHPRIIFAVVGEQNTEVYEASPGSQLLLLQTYKDPNPEEILYTCCWTSLHQKSFLLISGKTGIIRMLNIGLQGHAKQYKGHGNAVNEIKIHPSKPEIMFSASKDFSVRLWNLETECCFAIFGGVHGHVDEILSMDIHESGDKFITASMDHQLAIWDIESGSTAEYITDNELDKDFINSETTEFTVINTPIDEMIEKSYKHDKTKSFIPEQVTLPVFKTDEVHKNYVDSVAFYGDLIISKSCENCIEIWKPCVEFNVPKPCLVMTLDFPDTEIWFMKFAVKIFF